MNKNSPSHHVGCLWDNDEAKLLSGLDRLVYRSNKLGEDQRITNTGGGNTSSKLTETDPLTGEPVEVLWVKGSGGDLRTAKRENFSSLYQSKLVDLQGTYSAVEQRGVKTEIEDRMVGYYPHTTYNLNPRAPSIDTPLHAFVPFKHVDHMHPNSCIAIAAARDGERLTNDIFGGDIVWLSWQRPGFDLGLKLQSACERNSRIKGVMLGQHGLINWADDDEECYNLTLELIQKAARYIEQHDRGEMTFGGPKFETLPNERRNELLCELLPWLRGRLSQSNRVIGTLHSDASVLRFVNSVDAPRLAELGTSCPDHFLRTKIKPLYVDWDPRGGDVAGLRDQLEAGMASYCEDYAAYYEGCKHADSPPMRDPNPTVILIPGVGMITWGKNKSESRVTAEFYNCAIEVMRGAEAISEYAALPRQEAFDIEYWLLEEAKLRRMPPEKELVRHVVAVVGAGSGIGRAAAVRLAQEGAHLVCADRDAEAADRTASELTAAHGIGIGVAGTGISDCGPAIGLQLDVTDRASVRAFLEETLLAYGGLDSLVVTAGLYVPPDADGRIPDEQWRKTFDVNVRGAAILAEEARRIWASQGLTGSLVLTTSANAVVPKTGSLAYDCSKAAANHLTRELALELAPNIRVNAVAPATVVAGSAMFPRDRVIASLRKYGLTCAEEEDTDVLRTRLANFYAQRTLTKQPVRPEDQAEAIYFLVSDRAARTSGQILSVDGGLHEAFLR
jgi:rhamnulose-1-phosphate aldolase/alcohol dehydrogenase